MLNYNERRRIVIFLLNKMDEENMRFERALYDELDHIITKLRFERKKGYEDIDDKMHDIFNFIFK